MARKTSPERELQAAVLVAVGYTMASVAEDTGLSYSSVKRIKERMQAGEITLPPELLEEARTKLTESLGIEFARQETAKLIQTTTDTNQKILDNVASLINRIDVDDPDVDPMKAAKALTALATASKLAADSSRQILTTLASPPERTEDLPVLEVREMYEEEIAEVRERQDSMFAAFEMEQPE